jgi:hypothetical protein
MATRKFNINRAPVLTLWAAVVAMRLGYDEEASLTLGQAVAALNAQSKGRRLGIYEAGAEDAATQAKKSTNTASVHLLGREIPVSKARRGLRAAPGGELVEPDAVRAYLAKKFGEHLAEARRAMEILAASLSPHELATRGFLLYEKFRPQVPEGKKGWGAKGELDLDLIRRLAR